MFRSRGHDLRLCVWSALQERRAYWILFSIHLAPLLVSDILTTPSLSFPFSLPRISLLSLFHLISHFLFSWRKLITEGKGQPALSQERVDVLFLVCFLISQGHEPGIARSDSLHLPVAERSVLFFCRLKIEMKSKGRKWFLILSHVLDSLSAYSQFCNNLIRDSETCVRILTYGRLSLIVFLRPGKL